MSLQAAVPMSASNPRGRSKGRPAKAEGERLSETLNVRMTPADADRLYQLALRHGKPLNAVLRAILLRFLSKYS